MADYGLKKGDEIVSVNVITVIAFGNDNPGLAKAMVAEDGFRGDMVVRRDGREITLPNRGNPSNGIPANTAPSQPNLGSIFTPSRRAPSAVQR